MTVVAAPAPSACGSSAATAAVASRPADGQRPGSHRASSTRVGHSPRRRSRSADIARAEGVALVGRPARLARPTRTGDGPAERRPARSRPTSCSSPPARPRGCSPGAEPDGERILDWRQLYDLPELPEHLIVVGSGVTGAEFAGAYRALGLPGHAGLSAATGCCRARTATPPRVIEDVFQPQRHDVLSQSRAAGGHSAPPTGVVVTLTDGRDGRRVALPDDRRLGPQHRGLGPRRGRRRADDARLRRRSTGCRARRSPASTPPATAPACSCSPRSPPCRAGSRCGTRWARRSQPLRLRDRGGQHLHRPRDRHRRRRPGAGRRPARSPPRIVKLPLRDQRARQDAGHRATASSSCSAGPAPAPCSAASSSRPGASELILAVSLAVQHGLTVDQVAHTFAIYPSLSGQPHRGRPPPHAQGGGLGAARPAESTGVDLLSR